MFRSSQAQVAPRGCSSLAMRGLSRALFGLMVGLLLVPRLASASAQVDEQEFFESKVRPLLVERCLSCHDQAKLKGGLALDSRTALLDGGDSGPAAEPGKPEDSLLIEAVKYESVPRMPPDGRLSEAEIATLTEWVKRGLPWPEVAAAPSSAATEPASGFTISDAQRSHWAFQPLAAVRPPSVRDQSWPRADVDQFILSRLEQAGLRPAPEADRRTLIRRLSFDLTGLPPSPQEVEDFVGDGASDAYERLVDRLLAKPAYGERWGRHWLDLVRYADSLDARGSGQPGDILDAWRYRDWVVQALNDDLPYDRFIQLQVAGDVLPPTSESEGTEGFNRAGTIATTMLAIGNWGNGDADKDKILTDIADDQLDVVSKTFLGLTIACARCHDHKYDPISQADYYGLAGIFFSTHILPKLTPKGAGETILRVPLESMAAQQRRQQHAEQIEALEAAAKATTEAETIAFAQELKPQTASYLLALWDYQNRPAAEASRTLPEHAQAQGLHPFALRQWGDLLGQAGSSRLLDKPVSDVLGSPGVLNWSGASDWASVTLNSNDETRKLLTFTLPPRSLSVHPGPASGVSVSWTAPFSGTIRVTGSVADSDPAGGDGVSWAIDLRTLATRRELATGDLANGASMPITRGQGAGALSRVQVRAGDRIELTILPRSEYTCDTTTIELTICAWDQAATWDVTRDVFANFHAANPHADFTGRAGVWTFEDTGTNQRPSQAASDPDSPLGQWVQALEQATDRKQVELAADKFAAQHVVEDAKSPFVIRAEADMPALPAQRLQKITEARRAVETHKAAAPPALDYANAALEGGVPESPHAGVHDVPIHLRGRYDRPGKLVPRRFPVLLAGDDQTPITEGSGRRELAQWLTRPDHPLTARVMANRVWQHHFGQAIVGTPSNFGLLGQRPSHPELLDWLARRLVESGWSLKTLHREIVCSATYRQSSVPENLSTSFEVDPENHLLGRMNRRRLEAEALRDALLWASGELDQTRGGLPDRDVNTRRRALYAITIRSDRATFGGLFDQADSTAPADRRTSSTVAPQALYLMNNPFLLDRTKALAQRLEQECGDSEPASRIGHVYRLLFGRPPTPEEIAIGLDLISPGQDGESLRWLSYLQVLFCANEFIYVD